MWKLRLSVKPLYICFTAHLIWDHGISRNISLLWRMCQLVASCFLAFLLIAVQQRVGLYVTAHPESIHTLNPATLINLLNILPHQTTTTFFFFFKSLLPVMWVRDCSCFWQFLESWERCHICFLFVMHFSVLFLWVMYYSVCLCACVSLHMYICVCVHITLLCICIDITCIICTLSSFFLILPQTFV